MQKKLAFKLGIIIGLVLLMGIPLSMIYSQIQQRSSLQREVTNDIANASAGAQTLIGPVVLVRYREKVPRPPETKNGARARRTEEGIRYDIHEYHKVLPLKSLVIEGAASVETRYRGIYSANLFHADLKLGGTAELAPWLGMEEKPQHLFEAARAWLLMSISDLRGMDNAPQAMVNGVPAPLSASGKKHLAGKSLGFDLGEFDMAQGGRWTFALPLQLTGTDYLAVAPTAEETRVELLSPWAHPSFGGRFLPRDRQISDSGFSARWQVTHLARDFEAACEGRESMSVGFIEPVNIYLKAERAVKYGQLFIVLTFAAFFLLEVIRRAPIHPLQYAMVAMALVIFFLLLIALSEHLAFALAYAIGALGCIGIISIYLAGVFKNRRQAGMFGAGLAVLYAILYGLLLNEDSALLMGSLLLFAALGCIMLFTRHVNWYAVGDELRDSAAQQGKAANAKTASANTLHNGVDT